MCEDPLPTQRQQRSTPGFLISGEATGVRALNGQAGTPEIVSAAETLTDFLAPPNVGRPRGYHDCHEERSGDT